MHELALCHSMVQIIEQQAALQDFQRVEIVRLEIGALTCVEPEALRFCFDTVTRGTLAEGAAIDIVTVPAVARCRDCGAEQTIHRWSTACSSCGGYRLDIRGGDRMQIKEMEVH